MNRKIRKLEKEILKLQAELEKAKKHVLILCFWCGKRTKVKNLTFIQTHWYEEPWGCTGGDNWNPGEGKYICPKCGQENRLIEKRTWAYKGQPPLEIIQRETEKALSLKHHFKEIKDTYRE
jgi:hypothetical protein